MALSGSFYHYPTSQFGLYCEWSGTQNEAENYTTVTLKVYLHIWDISVSARDDGVASIDGSSGTYPTPAIKDSTGGWHNIHLFDRTVNVYHNADGTKTGVELRASWRFGGTYSGVSIGTITATTTVDLDAINKVAPTVLNRVGKLIIDADAPSFEINWTVRDKSYTHSLDVKNGSTVITTITGLTGSVGTNNKTISLTPAQRTAILNAMVSTASLTATYVLTAYSGSSQMGASSRVSGVIVTEEKTSAPIFTDFAYNDFNITTTSVTGNNQLCIQDKSSLKIDCTPATAKNGATITGYTATIGEKTAQSSTPVFMFGTVSDSGNVKLTVSAIDSRGYKTSVSKMITVIRSENINFDSYAIQREDDIGDVIQLKFSGSMSPIMVGGENQNAFVTAKYRTKLSTETTWSDYEIIDGVTSDDTSFTFSNDNWISLPSANAYNVQLYVADKLSYKTVTLYVNRGQTLVSFRKEKVGINTNDPQTALDVNGDITMNGYRVQGYVGKVTDDTDLDDVITSGIYYIPAEVAVVNHPQSGTTAILEVIEASTAFVIQRVTCVDGKSYTRCQDGTTWIAWS